MADHYEPNEHDRAAAVAQSERIADEILEHVDYEAMNVVFRDERSYCNARSLYAAKIEAAILAEMTRRGEPREEYQRLLKEQKP